MTRKNIITLDLTAPANLGQAMGRHKGKVIFIRGGLPGERVRARIVEEGRRWARGELIDVLHASPDRVEPPCPYFGPGQCGGCQWQHIAYPRQLVLKQEIVSDQLQRLGHVSDPPVQPARGVGERWGYRNHVQFAVDGQGHMGFRRAASHQVIPVDRCLLLHPLLDELHSALDLEWPDLARLSLRAGTATGEQMLVFEAKEREAPELEVDLPLSAVLLRPGEAPLILAGNAYIEEQVAALRYRISAESFFQVNTAGAEALVDTVLSFLEPGAEDRALDAYCGVGLFALALAGRVAEVIGIESAPSAALDFAWNVEALGQQEVTLIEGPVEEVLAWWVEAGQGPSPQPDDEGEAMLPSFGQQIDLAVVDPPRRGMGPQAIAALAHLKPRCVAYVSCDPAILARDAQAFLQAGYRLASVQPLDMFPQTYHVESVGLYVRD